MQIQYLCLKKKKSKVSRKPVEDLASLHPDFEIADMHSLRSSAKTLLHMLARISFYNFPSFKEKAPHSGDSGQSSTFSYCSDYQSQLLLPYLLAPWNPVFMPRRNTSTQTMPEFSQKLLAREGPHGVLNLVCVCCVCVCVSCTICAPMDCSPPGSSFHWILQARTL